MDDNLIEIEIPFIGFYESIHDQNIMYAIEDGFNYDYNTNEDIEISDDMQNAINSADVDYNAIFKEYASDYADLFMDELGLKGEFTELYQPREYNFTNDRIFCKAKADQLNDIRKAVYSHKAWPSYVINNFNSYDGFFSNYSNDYNSEDWTRDALDARQWCSILKFYINNIHSDTLGNWIDLEYKLIDDLNTDELSSVNNAIEVIKKYIFNQKNSQKLDKIKELFKTDIADNNLIIEIDDDNLSNYYVTFYIRHANTAQPLNDNDYSNNMIILRDISYMTSEEITNHLLINLIDRLKSSNQGVCILMDQKK